MKVGIFGGGIVGSALRHGLERGHEVFVYDKFVPQENIEDVTTCSVIFLCLPTPMLKSGKIELDCLEEMIEITNKKAKKDTICVIKSTAVSGTTRKFQDRYPKLRWAFCPEFLTDINSKDDFINTQRIVIGTDEANTFREIEKIFRESLFTCPIKWTTLETAEFVKYFSNVLLATKVSLANEMYQVAKRIGVDYDEAKGLLLMDNRFGKTHLDVPGYDGDFGYGGKCLVKDLNAFIYLARELGYTPYLLEEVWRTNLRVRTDYDW